MTNKMFVYMVTYLDDDNHSHLTFVKTLSEVRFLIDRFDNVHYEQTTYGVAYELG